MVSYLKLFHNIISFLLTNSFEASLAKYFIFSLISDSNLFIDGYFNEICDDKIFFWKRDRLFLKDFVLFWSLMTCRLTVRILFESLRSPSI